MVNFGSTLEASKQREYTHYYVDYAKLKLLLDGVVAGRAGAAHAWVEAFRNEWAKVERFATTGPLRGVERARYYAPGQRSSCMNLSPRCDTASQRKHVL